MDGSMADFQDRLLAAMIGAPGDADAGGLLAPLALRVHRNTALAGAIEALAANFPAVERELGADEFRAAAGDFARRYPPADPRLVVYGEAFPDFLESAGAVRAAAFARLDRAWVEAHVACDAAPLSAARLADADTDTLSELRVAPHPATRWPPAGPRTATAWAAARGLSLAAPALESDGTLILSRPRRVVIATPANRGLARLLDALVADPCLLAAATGVLSADPAFDLADGFARLLAAGALSPAPVPGAGP